MEGLHSLELARMQQQPRTQAALVGRCGLPSQVKPCALGRINHSKRLADRASGRAAVASSTQLAPGITLKERSAKSDESDTSSAKQSSRPAYVWTQNWWPVTATEYLHKDKPNAVTIIGRQLVVWWNELETQWVVMEDSCPHRLTPLSQGRIVAPGQLTCSYHGWSFNAGGACTSIPHLPNASGGPLPASVSNKACVRTYPSRVVDSLIFAWLDNSSKGLELSKTKDVPMPAGTSSGTWGIQEVPNDWRYWLEQGQDPGHANFLHSQAFKSENVNPIEAPPVSDFSLDGGFTMRHGPYEKGQTGMQATRVFKPPCHNQVDYKFPSGLQMTMPMFYVPIVPGRCRTFFSIKVGMTPPTAAATADTEAAANSSAGSSAVTAEAPSTPAAGEASNGASAGTSNDNGNGAAASSSNGSSQAAGGQGASPTGKQGNKTIGNTLLSIITAQTNNLPHWAKMDQRLTDQDVVALYATEKVMEKKGLTAASYYLASPSDVGIGALYRWLREAGIDSMWDEFGGRPKTTPELTLEQLLCRKTRHVDHCAVCQKGLATFEKAAAVLKTLSFTSGAAASGLLAVLVLPDGPGLSAAPAAAITTALAVGLAVAHYKVEEFKEEQFISGMRSWKKAGGLSTVPDK